MPRLISIIILLIASLHLSAQHTPADYNSMRNEVITLARAGKVDEALAMTDKMQKMATDEKSIIGMIATFSTVAAMTYERMDYKEGVSTLDEAEDYLNDNHAPSHYYSLVYHDKARAYDYLDDAENTMLYARKAMDNPYNEEIRIMAYNLYVRGLYKAGRQEEFMTEYEKLRNTPNYDKYVVNGRAEIYYNICKKDYDEALRIAEQKNRDNSRMETRRDVFEAQGNHKAALEESKKIIEWKNHKRMELNSGEMAKLQIKVYAGKLRADSLALAQENYQLEIQKMDMSVQKQTAEKEHADAQSRMYDLELEKNALSKQKDEAELATLQAKEESSKAQAESDRRQMRLLRTFLLALLAIVAVLLAVNAYYMRRLRAKRQQLREQLHKAEESERLKTAFMENINTNLIGSFQEVYNASNRLADNAMTLPEEKQEQLATSIFHSASNMMQVVNDVLNFSQRKAMKEFNKS